MKGPILVLGAGGFVGANLFLKILNSRSDITGVLHNKNSWRLKNVAEEKIKYVDITNQQEIEKLLVSTKSRTILNCVSYGAYSFQKDVHQIYETNFNAMRGLIEVLHNKSIDSFINAGTSSEYGINSNKPKENAFTKPNSHYALSKLATASYLQYMGKQNDFPCIHLRIYSAYGPLEDTSRLIPNLLYFALKKQLPPLVSKKISRDFLYVDDVCDAFITAAIKIKPSMYGEIYNIGSGIKTTIEDLVSLTKKTFNIDVNPKFDTFKNREWDLADWVSDPKKSKIELGWEAKTPLKSGLLKTYKWIEGIEPKIFENLTKKKN